MKRERILVVARDNGFALQTVGVLREAGYRVWRVRDGVEGLKKFSRLSPDLVVVEHELMRVNRQDPCSRIRQASYVPIIAIGNDQDPTEPLEIGADAYMEKPPDLRELTARVRALLRRKNTSKEGDLDVS